MNTLRILTSILVLLVAILGFQNCGAPHVSTEIKVDALSFQVDQKAILDLNNQSLSCNVDSDCEGIAYGSKACGGPSQALVVSKLNPNYTEILRLTDEYTKEEHAYNQATGAVSTCSLLLAPTPNCVSNSCQ